MDKAERLNLCNGCAELSGLALDEMPILNPEHLQDLVLLAPLIALQTGVEAGEHERKEVGIGGAIEALYDIGVWRVLFEDVVDGVLSLYLACAYISRILDYNFFGDPVNPGDGAHREELRLGDLTGQPH